MRKLIHPLLFILLASFLLGASTLRRGHEWGDDFAWYILQAKSLLHGTTDEFMGQSAFTNGESTTHLGPVAYPWGYPLILAPVYALKGVSPLALKLPSLFFYMAFLGCLYLLTKERLSERESLLFVALFAFNPLFLQFLDQILSDIPFLFFSTLSLYSMTRADQRGSFYYIAIGAAVFFAAFLRVTGVLLVGCFLIVEFLQLVKRHDRTRVIEVLRRDGIVCLTFVVLWVVNLSLFPNGGESYLSQYSSLLETAREFAPAYLQVFSEFFGRSMGWQFLYYLVLVFFLFGAWEKRNQEPLFLLFFALWMLIHISYPYWQGPRYIFPLLPLFMYFVFVGMKAAIGRLAPPDRSAGSKAFYAFWLLIVGMFLFTSSVQAAVNLRDKREINGPFDSYSAEVYSYIKEHTPRESVVVFFKPRVMVLMTDHPAIMSTECDRLLKGDYLVLSRKVGRNQQIPPEEIDTCKLPLSPVLRNSRFIVYKIDQ